MSHHAPLPETCPNCSHPVAGPYCFHCGQKVAIETPTLWEFIHEYLHHYVALDGALTRTLRLLVTKPGLLTTEFLAGRRNRYIKPLQLYITISFIFFIVLSIWGKPPVEIGSEAPGVQLGVKVSEDARPPSARAATRPDTEAEPKLSEMLARHPSLHGLAKRVAARERQLETDQAGAMEAMGDRARRFAPYAVFALMPIFALLLMLVYRNRRLRYGAHLVFALHVHAFVFLALLLGRLPLPEPLFVLLGASVPVYLYLALGHVYGGGTGIRLLRMAALTAFYFVFCLIAVVLVAGTAFLA